MDSGVEHRGRGPCTALSPLLSRARSDWQRWRPLVAQIYFQKVRPLEEAFKFGNFFSPCLVEGDFEAKPSVLLLGQYSTGLPHPLPAPLCSSPLPTTCQQPHPGSSF